jgi:hypothetical protein
MHKLSKEEGQEMRNTKTAGKYSIPFKEEIDSLNKGEMICIKPEDWDYVSPPSSYYHHHYNNPTKTISIFKRGDDFFVEKL